MQNDQRRLTRRDFLRGTVGATLAASVLGVPWVHGSRTAARSSGVIVVRDKNVMDAELKVDPAILQSMFEQTLMLVTGESTTREAWSALIKPDDTVGLVPTPHLNPTHPELIEVVKNSLMKEAGIPENRIISAQGGKRRPGRCTALISLPALKGHWLTGIGTVLKNYIMYSGRPSRYHDRRQVSGG